jgi:hypothetical protein
MKRVDIFWGVRQAKIRQDGSLSHAGMNRIRSQGLVSARRADTPSDPGDVVSFAFAPASENAKPQAMPISLAA